MLADQIITRAAALLGDPSGQWCTPGAMMPYLNQIWEDTFNELADVNWQFDESIVEITAIAANSGTSPESLAAYAATGGVLEFMVVPTSIDWKLTGAPRTDYLPVQGPVDKLDDVSGMAVVWEYQYRGQVIYLTPCTVSVDLRVTFQQLFGELTSADSVLALGTIRSFLAYRLASLVSLVRENDKMAQAFEAKGTQQLDLIVSRFCKTDQRKIRRTGSLSLSRRISGLNRWPNVPVR